jgi:DNA-directed RNA polymerase specialized sigma24 family protein
MTRGFETQRERDALDRHITGNYGEDFFTDEPDEAPDENQPSPADPAACIAEAAKEAIDMALNCMGSHARDKQLLRAIQQITYLRGH